MTHIRTALACALALAGSTAIPSYAQVEGSNCILAGRISEQARWAPRMPGVELLGQDGRAVNASDKQALAAVKQVRLSAPALLSRCDGNNELARGPDTLSPKTAVPAIGPGVVPVESVSFPRLRTGGELVELKLTVPGERVVMLTR